MEDNNQFIITCHGWSASNWVAHSINLHSNITCSHSAMNVVTQNKNIYNNDNLKKLITTFHKGYTNRQKCSISQSYQEIINQNNQNETIYYGSVHLYRLRDLPVLFDKFGSTGRKYKVMNLIRHPIDLVWSGFGQFKDLFKFDINELHWTLGKILRESKDFIYHIGNKYKLNIGELDNLAFIGAACVLGSLQKDIQVEKEVKNIPDFDYLGSIEMEKITSDKFYFSEIVKKLTSNHIQISDEYIKSVFALGKINAHKKDKVRLTVAEKYKAMMPWQKEVLCFYLDKYEIVQKYKDFEYDFTFLKQSYGE